MSEDNYKMKLWQEVEHILNIWMTPKEAIVLAENLLLRARTTQECGENELYMPFSVEQLKEQGDETR